jgi:hypothetical protein
MLAARDAADGGFGAANPDSECRKGEVLRA